MTSTQRPASRRQSPAQRQASILAAARDAFGESGYGAVGVPDVARAAGASPALVFHYFGSKAGLYTAALAQVLDDLRATQQAADAALPEGSSARDRVRAWVLAHLEHVAAHPGPWSSGRAGGDEPPDAAEVRAAHAASGLQFLTDVLGVGEWPRHRFALVGFVGFLGQCCATWVDAGCPDDDRHPLTDAALGALEGALGDWGR